MPKYVLITSETPDKVIDYLKKNRLDFKVYNFNEVLDLSDIKEVKNGWHAWRHCNNFVEGIEWDGALTPLTPEEKIHGFPKNVTPCLGRGWEKFKCKIHPKKTLSYSYITCSRCRDYSPKTLEGEKVMLEEIEKEYERQLDSLRRKISNVEEELNRQKQVEEKPDLSNKVDNSQ